MAKFISPGTKIPNRQITKELHIRICEACSCAEDLEELFFHDLLFSNEDIRSYVKDSNPVFECSVRQLTRGDIFSMMSMGNAVAEDMKTFNILKQYIIHIQHKDEFLRGKKHKNELSRLKNKIDGMLTVLGELSSTPFREEECDGISRDISRLTRAKLRQFDFKIVSECVSALTEMKNKIKEMDIIYVIHERSE